MAIPKGVTWLALIGATVVLGGFVLGERSYRNAFVHKIVEIVDLKDDACRRGNVAAGASCLAGCRAKPIAGPELQGHPPECRSVLWVATCGTECDAREGLLRTEDGTFIESGALIVRLENPPESFKDEFALLGIRLESGISGLWRYRAMFENPEHSMRELEKMEERIRALTYVKSLDRIRK